MFTASNLASWCHGTWQGSVPATVSSVSTDSRAIEPGCLYVALRGEKFDGHAFAGAALEAGAAAILAEEGADLPAGAPALRVPDTAAALRDLAAGYRAALAPTVVGLTGSVGKTTVKEITARLLDRIGPTAKTPGNWNNALGVPKSILALPEGTRYAVLETGTNHPGEIAPLAALLRPDAAILTNIGEAHIGNFGSKDRTANEKADLLRAVPESGFVVLDATGGHYDYLRAQVRCRIVSVSPDPAVAADFTAAASDPVAGSLTVHEAATGLSYDIRSGLSGAHQIGNLLLGIACARTLGATPEAVADALEGWSPDVKGRWEKTERNGLHFINDAYNANPQSMIKAVETFAATPCQGRRIAVLGDMGELGAELEEALHRAVGLTVFQAEIPELVCVGSKASWIGDQARLCGMSPKHIHRVPDATAAKELLATLARPTDLILLKASHSVGLEKIVG